MKKITKEKKSVVQWLISNKIRICVGICVLYLGIIGVVTLFYIDSGNLLEILYYVSQILSALFVIVGTAIAVIQYIFNSDTARIEADKQRKIEAAKMADEFRKTVIPLVSKLSVAYSDKTLRKEVIDYLNDAELDLFNKEEVKKMFPGDLSLQYRVQIAKNYLTKTSEKFRELDTKFRTDNSLSDKQRKDLENQLNGMVAEAYSEVSVVSTELSNTLEYMCICFNTNIADDKTVYQSLHNVFFLAVHMIYIFSFEANVNEHDRLFYNIMVLYKKWRKINREKQIEEANNKVKLEKELNSLKTKYGEQITVKTKCE